MAKKLILGTLAVFVAWYILDFVIHMVILSSQYAATAHLWRPEAEMKNVLMIIVGLISALVFVYIYAGFVANKSMNTAIKYGVIFGIGAGISMGYGSYSVMPITYLTALGWFLGTLVETTVGGILLGLLVKD
jgi:hypothetical protein